MTDIFSPADQNLETSQSDEQEGGSLSWVGACARSTCHAAHHQFAGFLSPYPSRFLPIFALPPLDSVRHMPQPPDPQVSRGARSCQIRDSSWRMQGNSRIGCIACHLLIW
ncbi:hypothetical protein KCU77_g17, partial [Aureobasidium melanogenum]